ncbi:hypothetical protein [Micromonospora gifhornensis]|uniref:hypothetical protein n=1 Tax=Micromonospora gifhornensis TaxID=84594 RepID=UPI00365AC15B
MSSALIPEIGNLAWAPLSTAKKVEIFDRYNGVPTLGTISTTRHSHLYWRVLGYTDDFSLWLYVPLTDEDQAKLEQDEGVGILDGIVFRSAQPRYVTVGVAHSHRLIFEREWIMPENLQQDQIIQPVALFAAEALEIGIRESLPSSRRHLVERAKEAVKDLVSC